MLDQRALPRSVRYLALPFGRRAVRRDHVARDPRRAGAGCRRCVRRRARGATPRRRSARCGRRRRESRRRVRRRSTCGGASTGARRRTRPVVPMRPSQTAERIAAEDIARNRRIGAHGAAVVPGDAQILTHCNAGALATVGYGTALGVSAARSRTASDVHVWVDETRPVLQGARLTAWELERLGIDATLGRRQRRGVADGARRRSTSSSSARIASPRTATSRTRSARTASRCSPTITASRSTSPRPSRRSILPPRPARHRDRGA